MKPLFAAAALVLFLGGTLSAQGDLRQEIKRLDLTDTQIQDVVKIVRDTQPDLEKARAEAKVTQAKLARLLLEENPARSDLERLVREGLEWDYKIKMIRIDRSLKIRGVIGKNGWAGLSSLSLRVLEAEKAGKKIAAPRDDDQKSLKDLLTLLRDLN